MENVYKTVKMNQAEYEEFGSYVARSGGRLEIQSVDTDRDGNAVVRVRLGGAQADQWDGYCANSPRGKVMAISDPVERGRRMRESGEFTEAEIETEVARVYDRSPKFGEAMAREARAFGLEPVREPEPKRPETAEELYGGPAYVEQTLPDGSRLMRPATPEELKTARQKAILGAGSYQQQLAALRADPTAFGE